jgi:ketosteroid isomerase-like protein
MSNQELIERMYAAAAEADMPTLRGILAEDFVVEEAPFLPYGGSYQGFDGFVDCFTKVAQVIDLSRLQLVGVTADDTYAYCRVRVPLVQSEGEATIIEEWEIREGRVVHARVFWFDLPPNQAQAT